MDIAMAAFSKAARVRMPEQIRRDAPQQKSETTGKFA
jgi:hypothetical protein